MMTVEDLLDELHSRPKGARVRVIVEVAEGHDVREEKSDIDAFKFEDDELLIVLG